MKGDQMRYNLAPLSTPTPDEPVLSVVVAGTGNVGNEFLRGFKRQQLRFAGRVALTLVGILNSRHALLQPNLDSNDWQSALAEAGPYHQTEFVTYLTQLTGPKVLIDITPSQDFARQYPAFIAAGCHVISANKQGVTLPEKDYQDIQHALQQQQLCWLSNTTCGAGIPIQRVLRELVLSGDDIRQVSGVFSGTLSWLLCKYDGTKPFSDYVLEAQALGYTEPDPRDDLSGKDVQRKLLVLARALNLSMELADIPLSPLLPEGLELGRWSEFWAQRQRLDSYIEHAFLQAKAEHKVLRYVASLALNADQIKADVRLVAVPLTDPLAALTPCDNMFVIASEWYHANPLVLKGPGAGREVTAGGLHADLVILAQQLIHENKRI